MMPQSLSAYSINRQVLKLQEMLLVVSPPSLPFREGSSLSIVKF